MTTANSCNGVSYKGRSIDEIKIFKPADSSHDGCVSKNEANQCISKQGRCSNPKIYSNFVDQWIDESSSQPQTALESILKLGGDIAMEALGNSAYLKLACSGGDYKDLMNQAIQSYDFEEIKDVITNKNECTEELLATWAKNKFGLYRYTNESRNNVDAPNIFYAFISGGYQLIAGDGGCYAEEQKNPQIRIGKGGIGIALQPQVQPECDDSVKVIPAGQNEYGDRATGKIDTLISLYEHVTYNSIKDQLIAALEISLSGGISVDRYEKLYGNSEGLSRIHNNETDPQLKQRLHAVLYPLENNKQLLKSSKVEDLIFVADCYLQGHMGFEMSPAMALKYMSRAANAGSAEAQYKLGEMYLNGTGVEKNISKAEFWIKKSADKGYDLASKYFKEKEIQILREKYNECMDKKSKDPKSVDPLVAELMPNIAHNAIMLECISISGISKEDEFAVVGPRSTFSGFYPLSDEDQAMKDCIGNLHGSGSGFGSSMYEEAKEKCEKKIAKQALF